MNANDELIIDLTKRLLSSIDCRDWETYASLSDENLSCIEPETSNKIVMGLDFHKCLFEKAESSLKTTFTSMVCDPHVKIFGNTALIAYIRKLVINDSLTDKPLTRETAETRVWNFNENKNSWRMVHFHKS